MSPDSCLYHPNWSVSDPVFLAEALLLWDRLWLITPYEEWDHQFNHQDKAVARALQDAHDAHTRNHVPSKAEKAACHSILSRLFVDRHDLIHGYLAATDRAPTFIHAEKLCPESVRLLEDHGAIAVGAGIHVHDLISQLVMAVLAQCCAGNSLVQVTDRSHQFSLGCRSRIDAEASNEEAIEKNPDALDVRTMILKRIPMIRSSDRDPGLLRRVLRAREKDEVNGLRIAFRDTITGYIERVVRCTTELEVKDVLEDFDAAVEQDRRRLLRELRRTAVSAVISKEGVVALLAGALLGAATLGGLATGVLHWRSYRANREKALSGHWSSWLYAVQHPLFPLI